MRLIAQRRGGEMAINDHAEKIGQLTFGRSPRGQVAQGKCVKCERFILETPFTDALSVKEFSISGLCQVCQDEFFGTGEDND